MKWQLIALAFVAASTAMRIPSTESKALSKRDGDHCDDAINNEPQFDCAKPEGHTLNPDGSCGNPDEFDTDTSCNIYCEVKRTTFLGPQQNAPEKFGEAQLSTETLGLEEGEEVTFTTGFSIGLEGAFKDAVALGASFEFSVSKTTTKTITRSGTPSDKYRNKWVFWPVLSTTCGSVTGASCPGAAGGYWGAGAVPATCDKSHTQTWGNICSTAPVLNSDGNPRTVWSLVYIMDDGNQAPLEEQPDSYKDAVSSLRG
ncbi:hypothetical protein GGR55DRAFT_675780 [Xylaria sp. FL0064]|nr:hypothetical protein GGR55DRAFT_675780 [Xylaria sp. FL0064]